MICLATPVNAATALVGLKSHSCLRRYLCESRGSVGFNVSTPDRRWGFVSTFTIHWSRSCTFVIRAGHVVCPFSHVHSSYGLRGTVEAALDRQEIFSGEASAFAVGIRTRGSAWLKCCCHRHRHAWTILACRHASRRTAWTILACRHACQPRLACRGRPPPRRRRGSRCRPATSHRRSGRPLRGLSPSCCPSCSSLCDTSCSSCCLSLAPTSTSASGSMSSGGPWATLLRRLEPTRRYSSRFSRRTRMRSRGRKFRHPASST